MALEPQVTTGNQTSRQFAESQVKILTQIVNNQLNSCAAGNQQVVSIQIVGSESVEVKINKINLVANAMAACAQAATTDVSLQNSIQIAIDSAVKQAKDALNFNPGSQTSENVVRTMIELSNQVLTSMTNDCRVTNAQALQIGVIDSKDVKVGIDAVDFMANATAQCTQNLSSIQSIINRVDQDFKLSTTQTQQIGPLFLIILFVIIFMIVAGYMAGGTTRIIIIIFGAVVLAILAYAIYQRTKAPPEKKVDEKKTEENSASTNARIEQNIQIALAACDASKASGYVPEQGFYWTFDEKDTKAGPYVPPGIASDGKVAPRIRTGGAAGRPQGWQPSRVREGAELIGTLYDDRETDQNICERTSIARPSIPSTAKKLRGK